MAVRQERWARLRRKNALGRTDDRELSSYPSCGSLHEKVLSKADKIGATRVVSSHDLVFDFVEKTLALVDSLTTTPAYSEPTAKI